jgi:hypothetical protein
VMQQSLQQAPPPFVMMHQCITLSHAYYDRCITPNNKL